MIHATHDDGTALHVEGASIEVSAMRGGAPVKIAMNLAPADLDAVLLELLAARCATRPHLQVELAYNAISEERRVVALPAGAVLHPSRTTATTTPATASRIPIGLARIARVRSRWS